MSATLTAATVKFKARQVTTKHGDRLNAVVTLTDGEEVTLWGRVDDEALAALHKGQKVQLVQDSKGYKLLAVAPSSPPAQQQGMTADQKRAIATYVTEQSRLFRFCWDTAQQQMHGVEGLTNEDLRAIASLLHIAVQKKFGG